MVTDTTLINIIFTIKRSLKTDLSFFNTDTELYLISRQDRILLLLIFFNRNTTYLQLIPSLLAFTLSLKAVQAEPTNFKQ